jgi:hypothetical protein
MTSRTTLLTLAGTLACGLATPPDAAGDFGISFHYSSSSPRYYASCVPRYYSACVPRYSAAPVTRCYTSYAPREYVYYDDCYDPAIYVDCLAPSAVVYDDCYPARYRTTYTRSRCYTRPLRHTRVKLHDFSGLRTHHYRKHVAQRPYYARPRPSVRAYYDRSGSHYRPSVPHYRHRDLHHRHGIPKTRVRAYRR